MITHLQCLGRLTTAMDNNNTQLDHNSTGDTYLDTTGANMLWLLLLNLMIWMFAGHTESSPALVPSCSQAALEAAIGPLPEDSLVYRIQTQWDGTDLGHTPVNIALVPGDGMVLMKVAAPFFDDPGDPGGEPGEPFPGLWDWEVAEAFFLSDEEKYTEVELAPHGQHLVLFLNGERNCIRHLLPMNYTAHIHGENERYWTGEAELMADLFPPKVTRFNAYAIHGSDEDRQYESLYPVPEGMYEAPDFHRLEYFEDINFQQLLPENWEQTEESDLWKEAPGHCE